MNTILHKKHSKRSLFATLCTLLFSLCLVLPIFADTNINLDDIVYDYAKAIYKRCDYGYGSDKDGIMFIVSMAERRSELIAFGYGNTALTDYGREYILDEVVPSLSDGDYNKSFNTFADLISAFLKEARENVPFDVDHPAKLTFFSRILPYLMSFGIAFIVALIICSVKAASMKTAAKKTSASDYMEPGSFHLTKKRDYYLYTTTHRVKREKQENSSGGGGNGGTTVDSDGFSGSGRNF